MRRAMIVFAAFAVSAALAAPALAKGPPPRDMDGNRMRVEVTVVGEDSVNQGLTFRSIVGPDLPPNGPFQELRMVDGHLETDYGPGDAGYFGGRWYLDANGNGIVDPPGEGGDKYFSCPLLGHGTAY